MHVDDIIVTGNANEDMLGLQVYLEEEFEIKDLGSLRYFLGIEMIRSQHGIFIS